MRGVYDRTTRKVRVLKFRDWMARHIESESNIGELARKLESEIPYPSIASRQWGFIERNPRQRGPLVEAVRAWQNEVHST